jgi:hypothetical protein
VINSPVRKGELIQVKGMNKCRGRPKIILIEAVKKDKLIKEITKGRTSYRIVW